jgi:hypothetical protein
MNTNVFILTEGRMAKYRTTDVVAEQGLFSSVNLQQQLLPDSFEYMLNETIGTKIDPGVYDRKYKNDLTGAGAVPQHHSEGADWRYGNEKRQRQINQKIEKMNSFLLKMKKKERRNGKENRSNVTAKRSGLPIKGQRNSRESGEKYIRQALRTARVSLRTRIRLSVQAILKYWSSPEKQTPAEAAVFD